MYKYNSKALLNAIDLDQKGLAEKLNVTQPSISQVMTGKRPMPASWIKFFSSHGIDPQDYIESEDTDNKIKNEAVKLDHVEFIMVPVIPIKAQAGFIESFDEGLGLTYVETLEKWPVLKPETGGVFAIWEVNGDSMYDGTDRSLSHGDFLLTKELQRHHWKDKLHFRTRLFVICSRTDGVIVKQVVDHDVVHGIITCRSFNPQWEDFKVNLDEVSKIYYILDFVKKKVTF